MPRDGALTLSEVRCRLDGSRAPVLSVVCEPCGRRDRYDVERLMRQYGWDAKLTDLLPALVADCPKRRAVSVYDR
jgi:RNase P subunit RPR2